MAATSSVSQAELPKSQYHHFIPRFILRNFSYPLSQSGASLGPSPKNPKKWRKGRRNYNEPMISTVDLSKPTAEIVERPVSRTFGMTDMYRDFGNSSNQHYLEEELSKLESRAGETVSRIRKHFEEGKTEVWIPRPDRNTLRKFLFIMKYRSSRMHRRFYHSNAQGYSSNDKERLVRYMNEKGFKKPVDVWFDNIRGILELKMDAGGDWMARLQERIYPDDAKWFIAHTQMMYLALCTPASEDDEFLLTENAYGIYEGPSSFKMDPNTGIAMNPYTEYHKFAVISPKLIMVLRSFLLPVHEEDLDEGLKEWRETIYKMNASLHNNPNDVKSFLEDLPVTKPRNSYSKIVNGRVVLLDGEDGSHRAHHKFCFRFFPLMTAHVNKINAIMLEESYSIHNIVFKSHTGLRNALEYYLTMPVGRGFKICGSAPDDPRLRLLKKLEQLVKQLGSDVTSVYRTDEQKLYEGHEEFLTQMLEENLPKEPTELLQVHKKLGKWKSKDFGERYESSSSNAQHADKDRRLHKGLDEDFREGVRENLRELFCQLPPRRVWLYLKQVRNMLLWDDSKAPTEITELESNTIMNGPENTLARGIRHLFRNDIALCRLMWLGTLKHIDMIKNPYINFDIQITLDDEGARRMNLQRRIVFGPPDSICDCGILIIEENAKFCRDVVRAMPFLQELRNPFWKPEENVEMLTRSMVRDGFADLMSTKASPDEVEMLQGVLFDVFYPTKC